MSAGSLRERVAEAVIGHLGDCGRIGLPCALVGTPRDEWCGRCDRNAKATDAVLAEVRAWLGSEGAREVVADSVERGGVLHSTGSDQADLFNARSIATSALAALIAQTKEAP